MERCQEIAGALVVNVKMNHKNSAWKEAYHWRAEGRNVVPILTELLPYLVEKKEQARLVILLKSTMRRGSKPGRYGTRLTDSERAEKERICFLVKDLNRRGAILPLDPDYISLIERRCDVTPGLPL